MQNDDVFVCKFPMWSIGMPAQKIKAFARTKGPGGAKTAFLFTDEAKADKFIETGNPGAGNILRPILEPIHLYGFMLLLQKAGFEYVFYDLDASGSVPKAIRIADFLPDLEDMVL